MAEIIDIFTPKVGECLKFVVDTSGPDYVSCVDPGAVKLYQANGASQFEAGDSFILLSMGFVMPEQFTLWKDALDFNQLMRINLFPKGVTTAQDYYGPNFPEGMYLPLESYEIALDVFFDCELSKNSVDPTKNLLGEDFFLYVNWLFINAFKVSMKNVPLTYNGETYYIQPFFKILHNFNVA
jgi:hypothetical protein